MHHVKNTLFCLFVTAAIAQAAGGAASLVAEKSTAKGFNYSWQTEEQFVRDCSFGANEQVCECVIKELESEYSEVTYLKFDEDLKNNIEHPDFISFLSNAIKNCDTKVTNNNYHNGYAESGSGGIGDGLAGMLGGGGGGIATKARGSIKTPSERDVDLGAGGGSRSAADIMKTVRQRTPGLRHIYNKYTKKKPGFQGKVALRFTIAPGGEVTHLFIHSTTTGNKTFDQEIAQAVCRWKFSKVKSGNTTVTIPFTFSE